MGDSLDDMNNLRSSRAVDTPTPPDHEHVAGCFDPTLDTKVCGFGSSPDLTSLDPVECAICGDYSVKGLEVHEYCLNIWEEKIEAI